MNTASDILRVRAMDIPANLKRQGRWLPWERQGSKKVPLNRSGKRCNPNNPSHWRLFMDAVQESYVARDDDLPRGLGLALSGSGVVVMDFDDCIDDETGTVAADAQQYVSRFRSYTEFSPSGVGAHVLLNGALPSGNRRTPGLELISNGFTTITGHRIIGASIRAGGEILDRIVAALPPPRLEVFRSDVARLRIPDWQ